MAQWAGQFSGLTHATRVADAEITLRNAATTFQSSSVSERRDRLKQLRKLAERLLRERLQSLKADLAKISGAKTDGRRFERLSAARDAALKTGVNGIFEELGLLTDVMTYALLIGCDDKDGVIADLSRRVCDGDANAGLVLEDALRERGHLL